MNKFSRRAALAMMGATLSAPSLLRAQTQPKIAFVMHGRPETDSWYFEHERGVNMAREAHGGRAQIDSIFDVPEWGQGDREKIQSLCDDGYNMIFTCSFGYMQSTFESALMNPGVTFEHNTGYVRAQNLATYSIRWYEGRTVEGTLAGQMTKTDKIGYIATFPIPEVLRGINSAFLAAKAVNPKVEMEVVWVNTWYDPVREEEAARQLAERGVDVIMTHANTSKHITVAEEVGIYAIGKATDRASEGPNAVLTSTVNNWGPYYVDRIGKFLDGTWESKETWGGLSDDMLQIAPISGDVPSRVKVLSENIVTQFETGSANAFTGPIRRQNGAGWLADGETATDSDLLTMDFFVEGMRSVIPGAN